MEKQYLGDGLYADFDGFHIVLTAENGISATDTVYLDAEVYDALVGYVTRLRVLAVEKANDENQT